MTSTTTVARVTPEYVEEGRAHSLQSNELPEGVAIYRIHGPFLFGSSDKLSVIEDEIASLPPIVVLRLRNMNAIDATGLHALENLAELLQKTGRHLLICGMRGQPAKLIEQAEFHRRLGDENICESLAEAIGRARVLAG